MKHSTLDDRIMERARANAALVQQEDSATQLAAFMAVFHPERPMTQTMARSALTPERQ